MPAIAHKTPRQTGFPALLLTLAACAAVLTILAIPLYVIRPFHPQAPGALALALQVRAIGPILSALCAAVALIALLWAWKRTRIPVRLILSTLTILTVAGAALTHVNIFERMFHPYDAPTFDSIAAASIPPEDMVLSVTRNGETHAYPIRTMGYHHIVNDTVGGTPLAATYCTLCHTGIVWSRIFDGRTLHFRLAGINNGNALMRDEETSTIWQQSTGEAIFGPCKGRALTLLPSNELSFRLFAAEQPQGRVLHPDAPFVAEYEPKDWEAHILKTHVVIDTTKTGIAPHTLMLGVSANRAFRAYPVETILQAGLIEDRLAGEPIVLVAGPDGASLRVFNGTPQNQPGPLNFARSPSGSQTIMIDTQTGSAWNFQGCAIAGPHTGQCLEERDAHKDFWFDWWHHNPTTSVYRN